MYIVSLTSKDMNPTPIKVKKEYISSLVGDVDKKGMMEKFSTAITSDKTKSEHIKEVLYEAILPTPMEDSIAKFYVNSLELAFKWKAFLSKVYVELISDISTTTVMPSTCDKVIGSIFQNIQSYPVTLEMSLKQKLSKKDIQKVYSLISVLKEDGLDYACYQYECNTCKTYNPKKPIHFEIEYFYKEKNPKLTCEDCNSVMDFYICSNCFVKHEFVVN